MVTKPSDSAACSRRRKDQRSRPRARQLLRRRRHARRARTSLHPTVFYLANQQNPLRSLGALARAALGAPRMALAEMLDRRRFNELLFAAYEGISRGPAPPPGRRGVRHASSSAPSTRARATSCSAAATQGHDVVLVSGALDFLMERLADAPRRHRRHRQPARDQGRLRHRQAPAPRRRGPGEGAARARAGRGARPRPRRVLRLLRQLLRRADALGRRPPVRRQPGPAPRQARAHLRLAGHHLGERPLGRLLERSHERPRSLRPRRPSSDRRPRWPARAHPRSHPLVVTLDKQERAARRVFSRRPARRGRPARRHPRASTRARRSSALKDVDAAIRYAINHPLRHATRSTPSSARG